ncbi:GNAT family N-acetyltransferase [Bifidobacterium scaligerum]|uniref:N-acetyltransferase n=1 Tax=Bifidobacterium scaligerum TaxID=2052656 RepID=A0A2M9HNJ2_9BIFI|nr:GNAT family N-acetyltransferase [Bifidobacterium scaligerum]PJM78349.1 N-acetyltransferase [Bifidobacterium scaligerum]
MDVTKFTEPRRLTANDDVSGFDCGLPLVNDWLAKHASMAGRQGTAVAYATFTKDGNDASMLAGFYTLSAYSIEHSEAPGWLRRNSPNPIPVILLGMMGVDIRFQTMHVGSQLLRDAVLRSLNAAAIIGARALLVEPATDQAVAFYERYDFRHIPQSSRMFTPLNIRNHH